MLPESGPPRFPTHRRLIDDVRFYVDEDCLGLGYAMMWSRPDVVTCGEELVEGELPRGIADSDWIPVVSAHGWVVITGNRRIRENPYEAPIAFGAKARIVCVHDSHGESTTWAKLSQLTLHWSRIERFIELHPSGPWWLSVPPSGPNELPYLHLEG